MSSFNLCLSVPCGRLWSMSMDNMEFGKDYIVVYLLTTFAAFPLKQWHLQHMNLWSSFFTSTKKKLWFVFLHKPSEGKIKYYFDLGGTLLEGAICPITGNTGILVLDFFILKKSKVLTMLFDAKSYTLEHWKKSLSWCWVII